MIAADKTQPDAEHLLHRVQLMHGPAQWHAEAARLHALFQRTHDPKHLRALQRHNEAMERWQRPSKS